jgi:hypothetical protein
MNGKRLLGDTLMALVAIGGGGVTGDRELQYLIIDGKDSAGALSATAGTNKIGLLRQGVGIMHIQRRGIAANGTRIRIFLSTFQQ